MTEKQKNLLKAILIIVAGVGIAIVILHTQKRSSTEHSGSMYAPDNTNGEVHLTGGETPEELALQAENAYRNTLTQSTSSPGTTIYTNPTYGFSVSFPTDFKPVIAGWDTNSYVTLDKTVDNGKWGVRITFSAGSAIRAIDRNRKPNTTFKGRQAILVGGPYEGGYMDGAGSKLPTGVQYYLGVYKNYPSSDEGYLIDYGVYMAKDVTGGSGIMTDEQVKAYGDAVAVFNTYKPEMDKIISTFEITK